MAELNKTPQYMTVEVQTGKVRSYLIYCTKYIGSYKTKEEASAEIDRLNAEWRKEQSND